jgi:5-methylcytosine-specific restriction endonuclease McrA
MSHRQEFSVKTKVAAFERCGGRCQGIVDEKRCGERLRAGRWHCDHVIPDAMGGSNELDNAECLCVPCHKKKTSDYDIPAIAKVKRIQRRVTGIKKKATFCGWRKMNGNPRWAQQR